jgi:predicted nucleic acid-binding Zn ribbon protein
MPTYVYRFLDREGTIEVQQAFTDDALTEATHPEDGLLHPVKKVFTPVGVSFKGNGFYKTDSRGSSRSSGAKSESSKADGASSSNGSSDSSGSSTPATPAPAVTSTTSSSSD